MGKNYLVTPLNYTIGLLVIGSCRQMSDFYISTDGCKELSDELTSIAGQYVSWGGMWDDIMVIEDGHGVGVCYFSDRNRPCKFRVPVGKFQNKLITGTCFRQCTKFVHCNKLYEI